MAAGNKPEDVIKVFKISLKFNSGCNCLFYLVIHSGCPNTSKSFSGQEKETEFLYELSWPGPTQQVKPV